MYQKAIAIDGPSGAGKSTIARRVADRLNFRYIDTGAMYRACTLKVLHEDIDPDDEAAVSALARKIDIRLDAEEGMPLIFMDGENVSSAIRGSDVTTLVSKVCSYAAVREAMVELQRGYAREGGVVMDGRDIGTYVLRDAALKIFLTADPRERGHRRFVEWQQKGIGLDMTEEDVINDLIRRDELDSNREIHPLRQSEDAVLIDSTAMTIDQVSDVVIELWKERSVEVL